MSFISIIKSKLDYTKVKKEAYVVLILNLPTAFANKFAHRLTHGFRDSDAVAMEPVRTHVATNIDLGIVIRLAAAAVQLFLGCSSSSSPFGRCSFPLLS